MTWTVFCGYDNFLFIHLSTVLQINKLSSLLLSVFSLQSLKCMCSCCGSSQASSVVKYEEKLWDLLLAGPFSSCWVYELEIAWQGDGDSFRGFGLYCMGFAYAVVT